MNWQSSPDQNSCRNEIEKLVLKVIQNVKKYDEEITYNCNYKIFLDLIEFAEIYKRVSCKNDKERILGDPFEREFLYFFNWVNKTIKENNINFNEIQKEIDRIKLLWEKEF